MKPLEGEQGGPDRHARRDAVIDDHQMAPLQVMGIGIPKERLPPRQFTLLCLRPALLPGQAFPVVGCPLSSIPPDHHPSGGDRPDSQFGPRGIGHLPNGPSGQRQAQSASHLRPHGYPSPG